MKGYLGLTKVYLPLYCLQKAFFSLRKAGEQNVESVALFAGKIREFEFFIEETIIPHHTAYNSEEGLCYVIGQEELYRLNKLLHVSGLKLIAQIHSHPGAAYHSETDDRFAVVTKVGSLSIVVPNFAFGPIELDNCAVFKLSENNEWLELLTSELPKLIIVK